MLRPLAQPRPRERPAAHTLRLRAGEGRDAMMTVDKVQGMAVDHGELWEENADSGTPVVVTFAFCDDDTEFSIAFGKQTLYFPVERLRKLLEYDDD